MKKLSDFSKSERAVAVVFIICSVIWLVFALIVSLKDSNMLTSVTDMFVFLVFAFVPIALLGAIMVGLMIAVNWIRAG